MNVLGIHGSPRKGGNSHRLLERALQGAGQAGAEVTLLRASELSISPCLACDSCKETGICVHKDDMRKVSEHLEGADAILLATPVFFSGPPSQLKALIDRCQVEWWQRQSDDPRGISPKKRDGYLIAVGATDRPWTFKALRSITKAFFWSLDVRYSGELLVPGVDGRDHIQTFPEKLEESFDLGRKSVEALGLSGDQAK